MEHSTGPILVRHTLDPVFDRDSRVLILGTMPSPRSREAGFYYAHPRNRFWAVLSAVLEEPFPASLEEKKALLLRRGIALWDVLAECTIHGASDSSIQDPVPNDFSRILSHANIRMVFTTGKTAQRLFQRFCGETSVCLPSPSPANCRAGWEELLSAYRKILPYLAP